MYFGTYTRYIRKWFSKFIFKLRKLGVANRIFHHKCAFFQAGRSLDRADLRIKRQKGRFFWQGKRGMSWKGLFPIVEFLKNYEQISNILIVHCGVNYIKKIKIKDFRETTKPTYSKLKDILPKPRFCWSCSLPRTIW